MSDLVMSDQVMSDLVMSDQVMVRPGDVRPRATGLCLYNILFIVRFSAVFRFLLRKLRNMIFHGMAHLWTMHLDDL